MSGFSLPVKPGPAQQLSGSSFTANATIYNLDTVNSVWVSSAQAVTPGNGMVIGPQGSVQWTGTNPPWACVDTGVTSPIILLVSDDVTNVQNPEAIALATVTQILESGVPQVFTETFIDEYSVPAGGQTAFIDVHEYASLNITNISNVSIFYQFDDPNLTSDQFYGGDFIPPGFTAYGVPVVAPNIYFTNSAGTNGAVAVSGTNRVSPTGHANIAGYSSNAYQSQTVASVMANNTAYALGLVETGVVFQGPALLHVEINVAGNTGALRALNGGSPFPVADTAEFITLANGRKGITKLIALPASFTGFDFFCSAGSASTCTVFAYAVPNY